MNFSLNIAASVFAGCLEYSRYFYRAIGRWPIYLSSRVVELLSFRQSEESVQMHLAVGHQRNYFASLRLGEKLFLLCNTPVANRPERGAIRVTLPALQKDFAIFYRLSTGSRTGVHLATQAIKHILFSIACSVKLEFLFNRSTFNCQLIKYFRIPSSESRILSSRIRF